MSWAARSMVCGKMWVRVAHRFLIALSVRPGNILTISDQRVPYKWTASTIARSSAGVHPVLDTCRSRRQSGKGETWRIGWAKIRTSGDRWLCQRSRHCFPLRPSIALPTTDHFT